MQRILGIAVVLASGMLKLAAVAGPTADEIVEGRIAAASRSSITVIDKQGENILFLIDAGCKITRDGKPSEAMMLGVGDRVRVMATDVGGKHTASMIEAFSVQRTATPARTHAMTPLR